MNHEIKKELNCTIPRLTIAGTHSGVGKTTIATGIMAALTKKGCMTQPFKVGPDYIDPSYHAMATGRHSRNLDAWMLPESILRRLFIKSAKEADISVIEGVMGLFDGAAGEGRGSSAHVSKILNAPVVLIIDVKSMAQSAAALVHGFATYDRAVKIGGVILNRVGSDRHLKMVSDEIEQRCGIPILGYLKNNLNLELPSRHLGLIPAGEKGYQAERFDTLAEQISQTIDLDQIIEIAKTAPDLTEEIDSTPKTRLPASKVKIGYALDKAFSFYYEDSLDVLRDMGAELVPFSPLHDNRLPRDVSGLYFGGGFPELFVRELAENVSMRQQIMEAGNNQMPIYAECGGLMYLCREITDFEGETHQMAGLIPAVCKMQKRLAGMGYVEARVLQDNVLAKAGEVVRGHEFHYSRMEPHVEPEFEYAYTLSGSKYKTPFREGYISDNLLATYVHLHLSANPELAARFVEQCGKYKRGA